MQSSCCIWCEWTSKHTAACDCHYHYIREASGSKSGWKFQKMGLFWELQCVWTVLVASLLPSLLCVLRDFHAKVSFHLWISCAQENSGLLELVWAGAPAKPGSQKPHKEEFWPVTPCLKTHTQRAKFWHSHKFCNVEDWQIWTWKHSWLIKNGDILLSQVLRWGDIFDGCLIPSSTPNFFTILDVKEKKKSSLFSQFTINSSICLQGSRWITLSMRS